jgi:type I restriction enzyme S subunit
MRKLEGLIGLAGGTASGVESLRRIVRYAAVRGQLTPSEGKCDEAVVEMIADGIDPRAAVPSLDAQRFPVPASWCWVRFSSVGEQRLGKMLDSAKNSGRLRPYLRNTNVQWSRFELEDVKLMRIGDAEADEYRLHDGDLLICEGGEPGRCAIWRSIAPDMYFQKALHRVRPRPSVKSEYLAICLQLDAANGVLASLFTGATIKHLTGRALAEYAIPLPPLAEQKRIVAKVDELMALCDRLEAQLKQRDEQAGVLAKAAVARFQADPTVENLEYLFDKRYVVDPLALRSLLRDLVVTMAADDARGADQALADFLEGESSNGVSKSPSHGNSGVPILRISAGTSRKDQYVDEDDYKLVELTSEEIDRHKLRRGDLLSCRYNGNLHYVGRFSCYLGTSGKTHVNPDKLIRFRVDSSMALPRFVCIAMNSTYARRQIESMCATTAGNIGLSASKMKTVRVPIPPLHVQQALVSLHDRVSILIDQLESQITASEEAGTKLLDALVAKLAPSN